MVFEIKIIILHTLKWNQKTKFLKYLQLQREASLFKIWTTEMLEIVYESLLILQLLSFIC